MFPFMRTLAFEALEDPSAGAGGGGEPEPTDVDPQSADPASQVADPAPEPTPTPAPAEIDWDDPEVAQMLDDRAAAVLDQRLAQYAQPGYQGEPQQGFDPAQIPDPLDDPHGYFQAVREANLADTRALLEQFLGPVSSIVERQADEDSAAVVAETIESLPVLDEIAGMLPKPKEGEEGIDPRETAAEAVEYFAAGFWQQCVSRYGENERAVQAAARMGAEKLKSVLSSAYAAGRASREGELETNAGAASDLSGAAPLEFGSEPDDIFAAARQFAARHSAT